jgi:hypothetical protein
MRRFMAILAVLLVFIIMPLAALAQEPGEGVITGQVVNDTQGGSSVPEVEVTLITFVDGTRVETRNTTTDQKGEFRFDNVSMEYQNMVSARYMEVDYYYSVDFQPGETTVYIEAGVCDTTVSDEAISIGLAHTIIEIEEESLLVTDVFWMINKGDTTYVGTDGVLVFTLPEGATNFEAPQELMPDYEFRDNNSVAYLVPLPPGETQLIYSYRLVKPDSNEFAIPLQISYPTDSYALMVGGEEIEVAVTQLAPADPVFTSTGERFIHFQGEALPRGTVINLSITNLSQNGSPFLTILWVIIAAVIVGIIFYLLKKGRRAKPNE